MVPIYLSPWPKSPLQTGHSHYLRYLIYYHDGDTLKQCKLKKTYFLIDPKLQVLSKQFEVLWKPDLSYPTKFKGKHALSNYSSLTYTCT